MQPLQKIICFDYGNKKIGIAYGQTFTNTIKPLGIVFHNNNYQLWDKLKSFFDQWQPSYIIIGLPLNIDGSENFMTQRAIEFSHLLKKHINLPIELVDERLTTKAISWFQDTHPEHTQNRSNKKNPNDDQAAALILQQWFDDHN